MKKLNSDYLVKVLIFLGIYYLTARLGLSISPVNEFATLIWLPSGISLAALLIFGLNLWPAITIGAFLANLVNGAPISAAFSISIGNTLEALVAAYLLKFSFNFKNSLERLKDVIALIVIGAILSTMISATAGVISLSLAGVFNNTSLIFTWLAWWIGDLTSILIITPLILIWSSNIKINLQPERMLEAGLMISVLVGICLIIFFELIRVPLDDRSLTYILFPPLIWICLRFGPLGAVTSIVIVSILTIWATMENLGPFSKGDLSADLLFLQIFMAVVSMTALILASVIAERRRFETLKDEFISMAAHELKTPLTTIKGYAQLLEKDLKSSKDKKGVIFVSRIIPQVDNLTRLISDFFDVSKIQSGKMELQKERFQVDELVEEIVEGIQLLTSTHKIKIIGNTYREVLADKYRVGQVLINLLNNAIKFSPKANLVIVTLTSSKGFVKVEIEDQGIGMSTTSLERVFERFFQAETQIRPSNAGLGLGLYISSEIIKRHGGKIVAKSIKGQGSTFTFTLPTIDRA